MENKMLMNLITVFMVMGAIGKTFYLYGDIPRVLPAEVVYPSIVIMNVLAFIGTLKLRTRHSMGYLIGALLALFYIITMLLNIIDAIRGIHQDLAYFLCGPLALCAISGVLLILLYLDYHTSESNIVGKNSYNR